MKNTPEGFEFTKEGTMNAYICVDISPLPDRKWITLSQPLLIDQIIQALGFDPKTTKGATKNTPAWYTVLNKYENGPARKASWKYRGIIGMLGYLQGTTRTEIAMETYQCARFNNYPYLSHELSVKRIIRYLLDTRDKGVIYRPDSSLGLEWYFDANFAGGWKDGDHNYPVSLLSLTGFVIMCAGCPILRGEKCKLKFPSVPRKAIKLICQPRISSL